MEKSDDQRQARTVSRKLNRALYYGLLSTGLLMLAGLFALELIVLEAKNAGGLVVMCLLGSAGTALTSIVVGIVDWSQIDPDTSRGASVVGMFLSVAVLSLMIAIVTMPFTDVHVGSTRDAIINDLNNLAAHAYQYRIRPLSMKGGGGMYLGYMIPSKLSSNENAAYSARVIHPDTVAFFANATYQPANGMSLLLGPDGRIIDASWRYWGAYDD